MDDLNFNVDDIINDVNAKIKSAEKNEADEESDEADFDRYSGWYVRKRLSSGYVRSRRSGTFPRNEKTCVRASVRESRRRDQKTLQLER